MRIGRAIYDEDGKILLQTGVELRESFIRRLRQKGYSYIYVEDERTEDVVPQETIPETLRIRVSSQVSAAFAKAARGEEWDVAGVLASIDAIIDEILVNKNVVHALDEIRSYDGYSFAHAVNVCVLSTLVGLHLGFARADLRELAVGTLLHDVGKVKIDPKILSKEGRLDMAEMAEVKRHARYGFDMLRDYPLIGLRAAHVAYQHHERLDGEGYPRGLKGDAIHPFARIAMVVDTFDAMTSDRPYRRSVPSHAALTVVGRLAGRRFAPDVVRALQASVAPYPIGARVRLDTGEVGVVVHVNRRHPDRPVVRILDDADGRPVTSFAQVDLSRERDRQIIEVR